MVLHWRSSLNSSTRLIWLLFVILCFGLRSVASLPRKTTSSTKSLHSMRQNSNQYLKPSLAMSSGAVVVPPLKESVIDRSLLVKSAVVAGSVVSTAVLIPKAVFFARYLIQVVESCRRQNPTLLPVLGGTVVTALHFFRKDIVKRGTDALFSESFDAVHHLVRVLAVVITVGSGCSLAFVGAAGEIGATVTRTTCSLLAVVATRLLGSKGSLSSNSSLPFVHSLNLAGAAAGVAANFDAPFTGAMYSYEVARRWNSRRSVAEGGPNDRLGRKLIRSLDLASLLPALLGSAAAGKLDFRFLLLIRTCFYCHIILLILYYSYYIVSAVSAACVHVGTEHTILSWRLPLQSARAAPHHEPPAHHIRPLGAITVRCSRGRGGCTDGSV